MQMTEEDQIIIVTKIVQRRRAELSLRQAETRYGESLFLIRQRHLAREKARKYCSHVDKELQHVASETVRKFLTLRHNVSAGASSPYERSDSSGWRALLVSFSYMPNTNSYMPLQLSSETDSQSQDVSSSETCPSTPTKTVFHGWDNLLYFFHHA